MDIGCSCDIKSVESENRPVAVADHTRIRNQKKKSQGRISHFETLSVWSRSTEEKIGDETFLLVDRRPDGRPFHFLSAV